MEHDIIATRKAASSSVTRVTDLELLTAEGVGAAIHGCIAEGAGDCICAVVGEDEEQSSIRGSVAAAHRHREQARETHRAGDIESVVLGTDGCPVDLDAEGGTRF